MITVTGVTGKLGGIVLDDLRSRVPADQIVAVARTPEKVDAGVEVRRGDYDDPASLRAAFAGADVLLLVSSPDVTPGVRPRQHGNAITAAVEAGVGRIVYTSGIHAKDGPAFLRDHGATEDLLAASGVPFTLLRNTFYEEALVNPGLREAVAAGELLGADKGVPVNFATLRDLGLAASAALTEDGHAGAVHELRGPLWTVAELAATLTEVAGTPVAYRAVDSASLGPAAFVHDLVAEGLFREPSEDLAKLLGREPTSLRDAVAAVLDGPAATRTRGGHATRGGSPRGAPSALGGEVGVLLPELPLEDLPARVLRQRVGEHDVLGPLVARQLLLGVRVDVVFGEPDAGLRHDDGRDRLDPRGVADAEHRDLGDPVELVDRLFHLP